MNACIACQYYKLIVVYKNFDIKLGTFVDEEIGVMLLPLKSRRRLQLQLLMIA